MTRKTRCWPLFALIALITIAWPSVSQAQNQTVDPAFQALSSGNVFVDPRLKKIDVAALQSAAQQANENPHTIVKIAVWQSLPPPYTDLDDYAHVLGEYLNIGKNALIVVVGKGPGRGVSIITHADLSPADRNQLIAETKREIFGNGSTTFGIADLAKKTAGKINMNEYSSSAGLWLIFLVVVIVVGGLVWSASRKRKQEMAAMRGPIDALRQNVLSGIEYLDNYIDVLPKNNPDSDQVRLYRQNASGKFDQAVKILDRATEPSDLQRAQGLLDRAQADVQQGRRYLDRATGGTGEIPGDDALRPEPLPESQQDVNAIPQNQRGVSFFSSQPAPLGSLVPVTITVNGQSRQVLVTPAEADELRQGRMPQVRAFQVNGRYVPWYEYQQYDPYRDYWMYQNSGWGGFGPGLAAGFIGAEILDSLAGPQYAPGYMPYAYSTDNSYYQGYNDAMQTQDAYNFGGGGDFGGFGGSGVADSTPFDDTTSVNVPDGGGDFGNNDFGGGSDFDSGGDFGGDSGGGDF